MLIRWGDQCSLIRATHVLISSDSESFSLGFSFFFDVNMNSMNILIPYRWTFVCFSIAISIAFKLYQFQFGSLHMRSVHLHMCSPTTNDYVLILMKKIVGFGCHLNWITEKFRVKRQANKTEGIKWMVGCWSAHNDY